MTSKEKAEGKKKNARRFVDATREIMETEGIERVSIRKISKLSGFHNSTIYLYFKDVEQLILLASMKDFRAYSAALASHSLKANTPFENLMVVWNLFSDTIFQQPHTFYNFFFGKYSNDLQDIIRPYYELYPEEIEAYSEEIEAMYYAKNIKERNLKLLSPLISTNGPITAENISLVNEIIISYCKYLLEKKCEDASMPEADLKQQMSDMLDYVLAK